MRDFARVGGLRIFLQPPGRLRWSQHCSGVCKASISSVLSSGFIPPILDPDFPEKSFLTDFESETHCSLSYNGTIDSRGSEATNRCQSAAGASKSIEKHYNLLRHRVRTVGRRPGRSRLSSEIKITEKSPTCTEILEGRVNKGDDICSLSSKRLNKMI